MSSFIIFLFLGGREGGGGGGGAFHFLFVGVWEGEEERGERKRRFGEKRKVG